MRHNETVSISSQWPVTLTFQHLDGHSYSLFGFVLIDAQGLCHYNLAEATFTQGLAQGQPAAARQQTQRTLRKPAHAGSGFAAEIKRIGLI